MGKELEGHINRTNAMWEHWTQYGVNENTELVVDFHFYATSKKAVDSLAQELSSKRLVHSIISTRTLIFFKGWSLETQIKRTWSLQELQTATIEMYELANKCGAMLDGTGAEMP